MQIVFAPTVPANAPILAVPVAKDGLAQIKWSAIGGDGEAVATSAASAARFAGEAGSVIELFVPADGAVRQVLLVGVGAGETADWEKAGGAITARLLTSGATSVSARDHW